MNFITTYLWLRCSTDVKFFVSYMLTYVGIKLRNQIITNNQSIIIHPINFHWSNHVMTATQSKKTAASDGKNKKQSAVISTPLQRIWQVQQPQRKSRLWRKPKVKPPVPVKWRHMPLRRPKVLREMLDTTLLLRFCSYNSLLLFMSHLRLFSNLLRHIHTYCCYCTHNWLLARW